MKDIIKPIVVLASICLVVTALLAYVNMVTAPIIKEAQDKEASQARSEVLKEAKSFEQLNIDKLPDGVTEVYKGSDNSGYVFMLTTKVYGGDIKLICGIKPDGSIEAVKTLLHGETKGIGSKVMDNESGYHDNYIGKTKDTYSDVDNVSGATISSKAYKKAMEAAFEAFEIVTGGAKQ